MTILKTKEGNKFIRADRTAVYDTIIYLSDIDNADGYKEVTSDEAEALKKELENAYDHVLHGTGN